MIALRMPTWDTVPVNKSFFMSLIPFRYTPQTTCVWGVLLFPACQTLDAIWSTPSLFFSSPFPDFGFQPDLAEFDMVSSDDDDTVVRVVRALEEDAEPVAPEGVPGLAAS